MLVVAVCLSCAPATTAPDAGRDAPLVIPPESCAQPGDIGNENGVGTFCTPTGGECRAFPLAPLCLASAAPDDGQWFCTRLCRDDSQCGTDAVCVMETRGAGCVPLRCDPELPDAGVLPDAPVEDAGSGVDAGPDGSDGGADPSDAGAVDAP